MGDKQQTIYMQISEETEKNAMDLISTMVVEEIAKEMEITTTEAILSFLTSNTGNLLYDKNLKFRWEGPSAIVERFIAEKN